MGGVSALGTKRIQFDFEYEGVRYRPTLQREHQPKRTCDARASSSRSIKARIANGTFSFAEEFPEYRYMNDLAPTPASPRTCNEVFDEFMAHCESRMSEERPGLCDL